MCGIVSCPSVPAVWRNREGKVYLSAHLGFSLGLLIDGLLGGVRREERGEQWKLLIGEGHE